MHLNHRDLHVLAHACPTRRSSYLASNLSTTASSFKSTSGNGYAYGYCTWYAFERRLQMGKPIGGNWGKASSWAFFARASGFRVDNVPEVGAVRSEEHTSELQSLIRISYAVSWSKTQTSLSN